MIRDTIIPAVTLSTAAAVAYYGGTLVAHPTFAMIATYDRLLSRHQKELYMTPASRERMAISKQPKRDRLKVVSFEGAKGSRDGYDAG